MTIGQQIRAAMESAGMSQAELARIADVYEYEAVDAENNGDYLSLRKYQLLAAALHMTLKITLEEK